MYKATNIDTDKALKAINDSRAIQERASQLRSEKERSYMEGLNKGLDIAESLFECSNYEKSAQEAIYINGVCKVLYELGKELDIPTQDIRDNIASVDEACALFADRIREAIARDKDSNLNIRIYGCICMRKIHECAEDIKNILNDAERTEEVDGDMLCSINELVDEILSIYCLEKQQRKIAIAEEHEILSEEFEENAYEE